MRKQTETDLVKQVLQLLRLHGLFCWRANAGGGLRRGREGRMVPIIGNPEGTADVLAVIPCRRTDAHHPPCGRLWGVEAKVGKGRLRPSQQAWGDALVAAGGLYCVVTDVRQLEELLRQEGVIR